MPKQINSFILSDDVMKNMKEKIKQTKKLGVELGFSLCKDRRTNLITKGAECIGEKCQIKLAECEDSKMTIGTYHTHPKAMPTLSILDMTVGCQDDITCVGSTPWNSVRCFTRKTNKSQCRDDVSPFVEQEKQFIKRGKDIKNTMRNPVAIVKIGILQFLKEFRQYDKDTAEYLTVKSKLLRNNFNQIEIR